MFNLKRPLIDPLPSDFYGPGLRDDLRAREKALELAVDFARFSGIGGAEVLSMASAFHAFLTGTKS